MRARNQPVGVAIKDGRRRTPFEPPPDSRVGRRAAIARDRPVVHVLRRAAFGVAEVVIGLLGISALLSALLPARRPPRLVAGGLTG